MNRTTGQADRRVCLNSLSSGWSWIRPRTRSMVDRASPPSPSGRFMSRTKTALSPTMKVGTPNTSSWLYHGFVLGADLLGRPARVDLGQYRVGVGTGPGQGARHHGAVAQVGSILMPGREQRPVHGQELLGEPVPHHYTGGQGQEIRLMGRVVPGRDATLGHMGLVEEERDEGHVPGGTALQSVEDVLMTDAGERAPVVPGHGEGLACAHDLCNPVVGRSIPDGPGGRTAQWSE